MFRATFSRCCSQPLQRLPRAQLLTPSRGVLAAITLTHGLSPRPPPLLRRRFAATSASSDPASSSPTIGRDEEQKELHGEKPALPFEPPHVPHAGGIASKGKAGASASALDASQLFTNTGFDTRLKTGWIEFSTVGLTLFVCAEDKKQQLVLTEVQADELETKLRYFEYQQRKLQDDFDRHRKLQLLSTQTQPSWSPPANRLFCADDHENRRFWIIVLIFVLLLEVSLPLLYYYNSEEMVYAPFCCTLS
jgi:hypothetical protein